MKIKQFNEMKAYLLKPKRLFTSKQNRIGGGTIEGDDLGTRTGFASIKQVKNIAKTDLKDAELGDFYFQIRNPDYKGKGSGTSPRINVGPFKTEGEAQEAYDARQVEAAKLKGTGRVKKIAEQTQAINRFITNFYNENIDKYGIRDYNKFEKDLLDAYKKAGIPDVGGNRGLYLRDMPHVGTREYSNFPLTLFGTEATNPSGKNADVDFKNFFKKSFFAGKLQNDPKLVQNIKRYLDYYNVDKKFYLDNPNQIDREALKKQYADVLDPNVSSDILYLLESDEVGTGKLRAGIIKQFLPEEHAAYIRKKDSSGLQYKELMNRVENDLTTEQLKKALGGETSIKKFMDKQTALLNEIFDTSQLKKAGYSELIFNADHIEGMAEIARMTNPEDKVRALTNLIGTTSQRNYELGMKGFSMKRKNIMTDIINKIETGADFKNDLAELNKITKTAYPEFKGDLYKYNPATKSIIPTENFRMDFTPENAFRQYFNDLIKSDVGLKELQTQYKNPKDPRLRDIILEDPVLRQNVVIKDLENIPGVTTASKIDRPEAAIEADMFKAFNERIANVKNIPVKEVEQDVSNVSKVIKEMSNKMSTGADPTDIAKYVQAEAKDLVEFGKKYGGDALGKIGKTLVGLDLPIFQVAFASMQDWEEDSPLWVTLPAAFTDEVARAFNLYEKTGGKAKEFSKFLASSFVPRVARSPLFKAVSKVGKTASLAAPVLEIGQGAYKDYKQRQMLPEIARQFNIPIEEAKEGYKSYIRDTVPLDAFDELNVPESPGLEGLKRGFQDFMSIFGLAENPYKDPNAIKPETPESFKKVIETDDRQFLFAGGVAGLFKRAAQVSEALRRVKNSTFEMWNNVRMFGEQKGVAKNLESFTNIPEKNRKIASIEDLKALKESVPEKYHQDLNIMMRSIEQNNFETAWKEYKKFELDLDPTLKFENIPQEYFPMLDPLNDAFVIEGPRNSFKRGRYQIKTSMELDKTTGQPTGKYQTEKYDTFDPETRTFRDEPVLVGASTEKGKKGLN
jgi:hypothetical protein